MQTTHSGSGKAAAEDSIVGLPAFDDNYIWLIRHGALAAVVDPGEAAPVREALARQKLQLRAILLTHHHGDHVGGVNELVQATGATVYGPAHESLPHCDVPLVEGQQVVLPELDLACAVYDVPGHTRGHIAYAGRAAGQAPVLFCGDTLFAGGCGRLFEGTPAQMHDSLCKLAALPAATRVYCGHEYTLSNLRWALAVDPDNTALRHWADQAQALRAAGLPTVPTELALESAVNPFLRAADPVVAQAARLHAGKTLATTTELFAALRTWKDGFR